MNSLIDIIVNESYLKMIIKSLETVDQLYTNLGIANDDSIKTKQILEIIRNSKQIFGENGIVTALQATSVEPELFHKTCVIILSNNEQNEFPSVLPGRGRMIHKGHAPDGTLFLLECETCKKIFKIIPTDYVSISKIGKE